MQDAECLQTLIQKHRNLDQEDWIFILSKLETQPDKYFKTELGRAFVLTLKEKREVAVHGKGQECVVAKSVEDGIAKTHNDMGEEKELLRVADWLMNHSQESEPEIESKKAHSISKLTRRTAVSVFACLSVCFMILWMHGQIKRNQDKWNLQQMKVAASQKADVFMEKDQDVKVNAVNRIDALTVLTELADDNQEEKRQMESLPEKLPQYKEMSDKYPQLYGWLRISGTQIDLPVMRPEEDRNFYLYHDFTGAESAEGALFVDPESSDCPTDNNIVIYGHNMKNGHIFGTLKMYGNVEFFSKHREVYFDTLYEAGRYEVVAVLKTRILNENEEGFRYYRFFQYKNEEEFQECIDFVEKNQLFESSGKLKYGDQILMLSTCEYSQKDGRLVVVARKTS